jgi:hypothetical protein
MASNLLRNLDRVAGVTGNVFLGERERRQALLQQDLARSHERVMERQKAEDTLRTRMSVQNVADKAAKERIEITQQGYTQRERMGIEAGKYDKRFGLHNYLTKTLKLPPEYAEIYGTTTDLLGDISDEMSSPSWLIQPKSYKDALIKERLIHLMTLGQLNSMLAPKLMEKVSRVANQRFPGEEFPTVGKNPSKLAAPPKGASGDQSLNNEDPFGIR